MHVCVPCIFSLPSRPPPYTYTSIHPLVIPPPLARARMQKATRRREDVGVDLYNQQQALAQVQGAFEQTTQTLEELADTRARTEERLSAFRQQCDAGAIQLHADRQQVGAVL